MIGMGAISGARTKALFKGYRIRPLKRLGQIFLIDKGVIKRVIEAAQLSQNDIVLEIGPGIGNLTMELAKRVHPVKSSPSEVFAEGEQFNRVKNESQRNAKNLMKILQGKKNQVLKNLKKEMKKPFGQFRKLTLL